mgnify:CR=1 FL=1
MKKKELKKLTLSEITKKLDSSKKDLFNLRFKKATRQPFKSHEIKHTKRRLAQLKTILTVRLDALEQKNPGAVLGLMKQQNYMTGNF